MLCFHILYRIKNVDLKFQIYYLCLTDETSVCAKSTAKASTQMKTRLL